MAYPIEMGEEDPAGHPALQIVFGFTALYLVYFFYIIFYPVWLGVSEGLLAPMNSIISSTAPITVAQIYSLAADLTTAIGTVFLLIFTGIAIFLGISSVRKTQNTAAHRTISTIAEAFMIIGCIAAIIYAFSTPDNLIVGMDNTYYANALNTADFSAMGLVIKLAPAIALFVALIYVIRHSGGNQYPY